MCKSTFNADGSWLFFPLWIEKPSEIDVASWRYNVKGFGWVSLGASSYTYGILTVQKY